MIIILFCLCITVRNTRNGNRVVSPEAFFSSTNMSGRKSVPVHDLCVQNPSEEFLAHPRAAHGGLSLAVASTKTYPF